MNRKLLVWLIPVALIAAGSVPMYRFLTQAPGQHDDSSNDEQAPQMLRSHASVPEKEHEIQALESELQKNPDHVPILLRLAQVARESGKLQDSIRYLRDAAAQDPKNADASLELGRALFEAGDVSASIRATEHVLEINPTNADALYNLGAIYGNLSQDEKARPYWEKAASLHPDSESGRRAKENLAKLR